MRDKGFMEIIFGFLLNIFLKAATLGRSILPSSGRGIGWFKSKGERDFKELWHSGLLGTDGGRLRVFCFPRGDTDFLGGRRAVLGEFGKYNFRELELLKGLSVGGPHRFHTHNLRG